LFDRDESELKWHATLPGLGDVIGGSTVNARAMIITATILARYHQQTVRQLALSR